MLCELVLLLVILAGLGSYSLSAAPVGTHSLSYDFTIDTKPEPGQTSCTVQAQVDRKNFLSYDCDTDKVKSLSTLGEKVIATTTWDQQIAALRDMGDVIKQKISDIKAENDMARGLRTLKARMSCQYLPSGCTSSSWQFDFDEQVTLHLDSDNGRWTEVLPGSNWMKENWESDREVTEFLHKSSVGDCRTWLEKFSMQWEAELEPTEPSSTTQDGTLQESTASTLIPSAWPIILTCLIQLVLYTYLTG